MRSLLKYLSVLTFLMMLLFLFGLNATSVHAAPVPPPPSPVVTGVKFKSGPSITGGCIDTAIGCIPVTDEQSLALFFLRWGMGLGGGVALILMVVSTYGIMTSAGDPRKLQAAKEMLISAITGLIMLVFSAFILKFIGVNLLGVLK